ncbi:MAG: hypothetical protein AAGJ50_12415, partial [Pseudomonadota bacterium]
MPRRFSLKYTLLASSFALALGAPTAIADSATTAPLEQFAVHAETSTYNVRYDPIADFMGAFTDVERGRVKISYAAVEQQGQRFLTQYTRYLRNVPVSSLSRDDQLAYWLNTRNMLVVKAMAESNSRRRLERARGTADAPGEMWTEKLITIQGVELSI